MTPAGDAEGPDHAGSSRSLAWRAAIALVLMAGFYLLALGIAGVLAWIPYAEWRYARRVHLQLWLFVLVGAFLILRSIVPRRDRFTPPGPRLVAEDQPRLFAVLRAVAAAARQKMPSEVYVVPDVNAWVSQRGGFMGLGGRRIMGLGLPLMQAVTVAELRAIVAHEFGHYVGGDVKLGPLIYRTREALVRTVLALHEHSGLLMKPFEWYAMLFFRVTHAVSRHQELQADALAARTFGAEALARGLRTVHAAGMAFQPYWREEVVPVLGAGYLPPLAGGFSRFLQLPKVSDALREAVETEEREGKADPYDTHPSLRDRIAALRGLGAAPAPAPSGGEDRAITLLDALPSVERDLVAVVAGEDKMADPLKPLEWDAVGSAVLVPQWEKFLRENGAALSGVTPAALPALDWEALGQAVLRGVKRFDWDPDSPPPPLPIAEYAIGAALALALSRRGFGVEAGPGAPMLKRGEVYVSPFEVHERIAADGDGWLAVCADLGIGDADLGAQVGEPTGPPTA